MENKDSSLEVEHKPSSLEVEHKPSSLEVEHKDSIDTMNSDDIPKVINDNYKLEIKQFLKSRAIWRTVGMSMETISKIMLGISTIISFSSNYYPCNTTLSFASGSISTLSLICLQFANFSFRESKLSTNNLNILLKNLHEQPVPELQGSIVKHSPSSENNNI